jgi:hypothetical protein
MHTPGIHRAEERRIDAALSILQTHTCITHREPDRGGGTSLFRGGSFLVKNALRVTQYSKERCRPRSMRVADRYPAVLRNDHGRSHASRDTFARDTTDHRYIPPRTAVKIALHNERADATRVTRRPCRVEHPGAEVGNVSHEPSRAITSGSYVLRLCSGFYANKNRASPVGETRTFGPSNGMRSDRPRAARRVGAHGDHARREGRHRTR